MSYRKNLLLIVAVIFCFSPQLFAGEPDKPLDQSGIIRKIEELLSAKGLSFETTGVVIRDITDNNSSDIYKHNGKKLFKTASVMKAVTTAAALDILKPEYRFTTTFLSEKEIENGKLNGNLYLKAGADPFIVPEEMTRLINEFILLGLKEISGNLIIDLSIHNDSERPSGWSEERFPNAYSAKISPLTFAFNSISVKILAKDAEKPEINISPVISNVQIKNLAQVSDKGGETITIEVKTDGQNEIVELNGNIRRGNSYTRYLSVNNPLDYFVTAFTDELQKNGIKFSGKVKQGKIGNELVTILEHDSLPLSNLVRSVNLYSNNVMAELLLRQIGHEKFPEMINTAGGIKAIREFLQQQNLNILEINQKDGSGLTEESYASANLIASLIQKTGSRFDIGPEYLSSLSATGGLGTLRKHLEEEPYYRRVRGKTGFINGIITVAGTVSTVNNRQLVFCLLLNNVERSYRDTWDTILDEVLKLMVQL